MNGDAKIVEAHRLALGALELVDALRSGEVPGNPAIGIVIAEDDNRSDACASETSQWATANCPVDWSLHAPS
jgi:hypothetical protein